MKSTPTLRARFRSATRDALLDAAADIFARQGAAIRMEDIAAAAGVSVGTVYNYFADRAELVQAVLESRTRGLLADLDAVLQQESPAGAAAFDATLFRFVEALMQHFDANRALLTAMLEQQQDHGMDAKAVSRRNSKLEQVTARAEQLMARGISIGALDTGDAAVYAALLVGMIRGLVLSALARRERSIALHARAVVDVFLKGAGR